MCTRYYIETDNELQSSIESVQSSSLTAIMQKQFGKTVTTIREVRPTDIAAVIASNKNGVRSVFPMVWGFTIPTTPSFPADNKDIKTNKDTRKSQLLVNCRVETASKKPLWRNSWLQRRCIIPASYYFEWGPPMNPLNTLTPTNGRVQSDTNKKRKGKKIKYAIRPMVEKTMCLAGLYRIEDGFPHFAVLTREPGDNIRFIHNRMPVILRSNSIDTWINPHIEIRTIDEISQAAITEMEYHEIQ